MTQTPENGEKYANSYANNMLTIKTPKRSH